MYPVNSNNINVCKKKAEKDHMTQTHSDSNFPVVCYFVQSTG